MNYVLVLAALPLAACLSPAAHGGEISTTVSTRDELISAVINAVPGTRVLINPGRYRGGIDFSDLRGTESRPIVIAAADPRKPPVFEGGASCFHLTNPSHVELHNLVLIGATGNGLNIDDGGSYESPAHHVVLRGLAVRDVGPNGNRDGIKLSGLDNFLVDSCTVERWGSGGSAIDMVGCHQGRILGCTFRHGRAGSGNGVQMKGGSRNIAVQRCRFENAGDRAVNIGGSTGLDYFRPKPCKYEAKDITVEDSTFIGSTAPVAFVGVDGAVVRYNTIYRPTRWVVRILQETREAGFVPCRAGRFENNLIAFRSDELRTAVNVGDGTLPESFAFERNHWYCIDNPSRSDRVSLPVRELDGSFGQDPQFVNAPAGDLRLKKTSRTRSVGVRSAK